MKPTPDPCRPRPTACRALLSAACLFLAAGASQAQSVVLNELQAVNDTTVADPDFGAYVDWIEFHNRSASAVDLGGYLLSDDPDRPDRWRLPAGTVVEPGGYLLVWADGEDRGLHANFALDGDGERVRFSNPAGVLVDEVAFGPLPADVSYGRDPSGAWRYFLMPTPGAPNTATPYAGLLQVPALDLDAGFYRGPQQVTLAAVDPGAVVRYTTDGSRPTEASPVAAGPVSIETTTVIRAAAFRPGYATSAAITATYFVDETPTLPVVSLSTDPAHFFDDEIGIYVVGTSGVSGYCRSTPHNWNREWERPVHVEFFEPDGTPGFAMDAGVQIFGGCTRIYDQKSLALYARSRYGPERFEYPVFPWLGLESYNNLVLRSSAQDWWRTMFRDGMIQTLIRQGMAIETQAYRPALVFLNGTYWGIHNLREKLNEHYFADHFGLESEQVEILQHDDGGINGRSEHFDALMAFVRTSAVAEPDAFERVGAWIDLDAYLDYLVAEIYAANADWPGNNLKLWRPRTPDGRWRWVIFDMDMGFGGNAYSRTDANTLAHATSTQGELWSNPPWSTELLRRLLINARFRDLFIQRMAAHVSTTFERDHVLGVIDSLKANIAVEIPRHRARWPNSISYAQEWDTLIQVMRDFAAGRAAQVRGHYNAYFGLPGSARLHLAAEPQGAGTIEAAGVPMPLGGDGPVFFRSVPLGLRAIPAAGFRFVRWEGASTAITDTTALTLTGETSVTAVFEPGTVALEEPGAPGAPGGYRLGPGYPNPASGRATIEFETPAPGPVTIDLFDALGRRVVVVTEGPRSAGRHMVHVSTAGLPAGVYLVVMRAPGFRASRRMTVLG